MIDFKEDANLGWGSFIWVLKNGVKSGVIQKIGDEFYLYRYQGQMHLLNSNLSNKNLKDLKEELKASPNLYLS